MNIHPALFSEVHNSLISHQGLTGSANTVMDPSLSERFFLDVNTDNLKKKNNLLIANSSIKTEAAGTTISEDQQ